jgi:hypothetical protein
VRANLPQGTDVTLLEISDRLVRLRVDAAAGGRGTPVETIRTRVDAAIRDAAPEVGEVEVDVAVRTPALPLIQLTRR